MKIKFLLALFMSCALGLSAQGYLDGIEYYRADQYANARSIFERTLNDADTDKSVSYYYLGQLAIKYQEFDKALEYFNKGIEANPNNGYNYVGLAALELKKGNKKEAENHIKTAKKLSKKDAQLLIDVARAYYNADSKNYRKNIEKTLKDAYKINPEEPDYYLFLGDTVIVKATNNRELGDAAAHYDMAINFARNNSNKSAYTVVKYSSLYEKLNPEYAISSMREYLATNPNSALAQRELAERLYNQRMYDEAAEEYGKYIKMPGHFADDEERYAILLFTSNKLNESFEAAKKAATITKDPFVMERIMFYSKAGLKDYAEAYKYGKAFFEKYPDPKTHSKIDFYYYATTTENLARTDTANATAHINTAIDSYKNMIAIDSTDISAYKSLASVYHANKDFANAISYTEKYIAIAGEAKDSDYRLLATILADNADAEKDEVKKAELKARALETIDKAVEVTKSPYVARAAGLLYYQVQGQYTADFEKNFLKSLSLLDASKDFYTKNASDVYKNVLRSLGVYYYNSDNLEKAKEMFTRYIEFAPEDAQISNILSKMQ